MVVVLSATWTLTKLPLAVAIPRVSVVRVEPVTPTCAQIFEQVGGVRHDAPCGFSQPIAGGLVVQVGSRTPVLAVVNNGQRVFSPS